VVWHPGDNKKLEMEDGSKLLIEGKPFLLDHIAICEQGVWDKGGEPSGVDAGTREDTMADNESKTTAAADSEKKSDPTEKILESLNSLHARMDSFEKRMDDDAKRKDEDEKEEEKKSDAKSDAKRDDKMRDDAKRDDRRDDKSKRDDAKRDDEEEDEEKSEKKDDSKKRDDEDEGEEKDKAKEVVADKRKRKDDDDDKRDDRKRDDAKKRDDAEKCMDAAADDVAGLRQRLDALDKRMPATMSDADFKEMAEIQSRADQVLVLFGGSAPRFMAGEKPIEYRVRLLNLLKQHSPGYKDVSLERIAAADSAALGPIEATIMADAAVVGRSPATVGEGELRCVSKRMESGHMVREYIGQPRTWMDPFAGATRRVVRSFNQPSA